MQLPFTRGKKEEKEYFLTLVIERHKLSGIIFEEVDKNLHIISTFEKEQKRRLEEFSAEELVVVCDEVISTCEEHLPEGSSLDKTIFAVPHDWVIEGKIKKDYLLRLKKVCDDLSLTPIGFIVSIEAIVAFLQKKQGAPLTAVFIERGRDEIILYLVRAGNIVEIKQADISSEEKETVKVVEKLLKDVAELEVLPSKLVLLSQEHAERDHHAFLSHKWTHDLPFLHEPQVTTLEAGFENEAVISGVAGQMGFDVNESTGVEESKGEPRKISDAEELGFLKEKDVADIEKDHDEKPHDEIHEESEDSRELEVESEPEEKKSPIPAVFSLLAPLLSFTVLKRMKFGRLMKIPRISFLPFRGVIIIPIALIVLLAFVYLYYAMLLRADVAVFVNKKSLAKDINITLSPDADTSAGKATIHLAEIPITADGSDSQDTTGKKDTGDKARGEITIYNKTENSKKFVKEASLVGPNNLEFVLLDDAQVASTSAFATSLASTKVKVEAAKFGTEYNLPSGTNFSFKEFPASSYFAKNDSAFSGGTKKSIRVVAKKDLDSLADSITDSIQAKAVSSLSSKISGGDVVIPTPLSFTFKEKKFDKKENEEASKVSLSATISFTFGSYKKSDLESLVKDLAKDQIPQGYSFAKDSSNIELADVKVTNDTVSGKLKVNANYLPELDSQKITKEISGKNLSRAQELIKQNTGVSDVTIILRNKLPFLPGILPIKPDHIKVDVKTQ